MRAAGQGFLETVRMLLAAGANRTLRHEYGKTAADLAKTEEIRTLINTYTTPPAAAAAVPTPPAQKQAAAAADPVPPCPAGTPAPAPVPAPTPASTATAVGDPERVVLEKECDALAQQAALAPSHMEAVQQREALQQQYDAAVLADDFELEGTLGLQLESLKVTVPALENDVFVSLADRHAALIDKVTLKCRALREVKDMAGLKSLGAKLAMLKALDLSALPRASDSDPVYVPPSTQKLGEDEGEEDGANDPVYVPNTTTITSTTSTTPSATSAAATITTVKEVQINMTH